MKKLSILFIAIIAFIGFNACTSDDDVVFVAQPDEEGISFTNSFSETYTLTNSTSDNLAERFVWNEVDFDAPTTLTYELQGSADSEFNEFDVLGSTSSNNMGVTVGEMLSLAEDAELDNDPQTEAPNVGQIYFRVRAFAGDGEANALEEYSDESALTVELPEAEEEEEEEGESKRQLYLVGDATEAGWSENNNNTPLFRDGDNNDIYYFQGRFAGGDDVEGFKLLEELGAWQPQWGGTNGELFVNPGDGDDPDAFGVDNDTYYSLMVNVDEMTYTWEEIDQSAATVYNEIGIIGTATTGDDDGWNDDIDLTQSDFNPHIWYINDLELADGEAKFRANGAWDVSWGAATEFSGQGANNNDPNIPVTAGTYDVWFNTLDARYILIPQQ